MSPNDTELQRTCRLHTNQQQWSCNRDDAADFVSDYCLIYINPFSLLIINLIHVVTSCLAVFTLSSATASGRSVSTPLREEDEELDLQVRLLPRLAASPDRLLHPCCSLNLGPVLGCSPPPSRCPLTPLAPPQTPTTPPAPASRDTQIEKRSGVLSAGGASWSAARSSLRVQRPLVDLDLVSLRGWRAPGGA